MTQLPARTSHRTLAALATMAVLVPSSPALAQTAPDTEAPRLVSYDITPEVVDVTDGPADVVVTARITDATAVDTATPRFVFASDTSTQQSRGFERAPVLVSGDRQDGTYTHTLTIPAGSAPGTWTGTAFPTVDSLDNQGEFLELTPKLTVVNGPTTPPTTPPTSPPPAQEAAPVPVAINASRGLVDHGQALDLRVFGPVGADVQLFGNGRLIREAVVEQFEGGPVGVAAWTLQPGDRTLFHAVVDGVRTETLTVRVRRTVSIGIREAGGVYTFSGRIARAEAGLQVTVARLDAVTKRVTGVSSTRTDAAGRYTIRTGLPVGQAGYYALTGVNRSSIEVGRSRLYGLVVPARPVVRPVQPTLVSPTVTIGARAGGGDVYTLSGRVTPGRSVPLTLAEIRGGRLVGVAGGRARADGSYSFDVRLNREAQQTTRTFQVLTAAGQGLRAASSRAYGLVVPARPVVVRPAAETAGQRNARLKGAEYLRFLAFSRSGLIRQLEFEGFSTAEATYGTDAQRADWRAQAARKAREYLDVSPFSRDGLIRQLEFEGFTRAEAEYGVRQVGL